jgi:hypothetical protein
MADKPSHLAKMAKDYDGADGKKQTRWTDIGAAWPVKDGKGLKVKLDAIPTSGEIILLPNEPKAEQ